MRRLFILLAAFGGSVLGAFLGFVSVPLAIALGPDNSDGYPIGLLVISYPAALLAAALGAVVAVRIMRRLLPMERTAR